MKTTKSLTNENKTLPMTRSMMLNESLKTPMFLICGFLLFGKWRWKSSDQIRSKPIPYPSGWPNYSIWPTRRSAIVPIPSNWAIQWQAPWFRHPRRCYSKKMRQWNRLFGHLSPSNINRKIIGSTPWIRTFRTRSRDNKVSIPWYRTRTRPSPWPWHSSFKYPKIRWNHAYDLTDMNSHEWDQTLKFVFEFPVP